MKERIHTIYTINRERERERERESEGYLLVIVLIIKSFYSIGSTNHNVIVRECKKEKN